MAQTRTMHLLLLRCGLLAMLGGCAGTRPHQGAPSPTAPAVVHYEMEPMAIEATRGSSGLSIESFDAEELFEQGGAALSGKRYDEAIQYYDKLLGKFPGSHYARSALYNRGLAHADKKDWPRAVESFRELAEKYTDHGDAKDALFQLGACFAELENWPASIEIFVRLLDRKDLTADDRIEAIARRGFAQFRLNDLDQAERTFRTALAFREQIETQERLATDFFWPFPSTTSARSATSVFAALPSGCPKHRWTGTSRKRPGCSSRPSGRTSTPSNTGTRAGLRQPAFRWGPSTRSCTTPSSARRCPAQLDREAREVYVEELRKKIRILLEKSMRWTARTC